MAITEIRLLPPLALARLGSSPEPMDNYELVVDDPVGPRRIVAAPTLRLADDGTITEYPPSVAPVKFRDANGLIKPVAPFFELFARVDGAEAWVAVTESLLATHGASVQFSAHLANHKLERRTGDRGDRIVATVAPFRDHAVHPLNATCAHFLDGESVPFGNIQFAKPDDSHRGLRVRFTPASGKVYGSKSETPNPDVVRAVYDPDKGAWARYSEPDAPTNDFAGRKLTNPAEIFAGYDKGGRHFSYGYVDDECDGVISAHLDTGGTSLTAIARVVAGPPTFAPDSKPIRTVADELEQVLHGPDALASPANITTARKILRRALETVRLMNTAALDKGGTTRGVGMARMDILDVARKSEPIFDPEVAEPLAIRSRHERVLLALESGSLAWFARVLRRYDEVGDLTDEGRRKMPGMMRNADGRHLALTRRQLSTIKAAAEQLVAQASAPVAPAAPTPLNLSAQLAYRAQGNPPNSLLDTAISNAYPGLEMDFRNAWRRILEGLVLHESLNFVLDAEEPVLEPLVGMFITEIDGFDLTAPVIGPNHDGVVGPLADQFGDDHMALEWSNALADIVHLRQGQVVHCKFRSLDGKRMVTHDLVVRRFFAPDSALISEALLEPGALTQSLCAPWQNDYRECACFYWAANRPDYVNVEPRADGASAGNNWMQRDRTSATPKIYINDDWQDPRLLGHTDLIADWERVLRFVIGNQDAE